MRTQIQKHKRPGGVVSSPTATEEIGAMGRDIESRQGMYRVIYFLKNPKA
jgi:hypothetical protein